MTTRNALRQAIASGQAREVKALLDDREALQVLKTYLQIPDDQLREHLRRLVDEVGQGSAAADPKTI
jgi:predicted component of type VI protein secretion system